MNKRSIKLKSIFLGIIFLIFLSVVFVLRSNGYTKVKKRFFRMDTITEITLVVKDKRSAETLWVGIDSLLKDWEERFSVSHPRSEVRAVNERKYQTIKVSHQMAEMISKSLQYGDLLEGGFDLTILPIKELWGFTEKSVDDMTAVPSQEKISKVLEQVNFRNVEIKDSTVSFKNEKTRIDVGGIAKGFVLREIGELLDSNGVTDYLVCAGGDILTKGNRMDGNRWRVGIADPRNADTVAETINIKNCSIVTSGDYERFKIINGKRYHHLFDSKTGQSCKKNRSVTILTEDPVTADILSTGLFCRDALEILNFINERPDLQCFVIDSEGKVYKSKNWNGNNAPIQDIN